VDWIRRHALPIAIEGAPRTQAQQNQTQTPHAGRT
jgi:hypothetical protein